MFGRRELLALMITVLAAVAVGVSAYLTWVTLQASSVAGCTANAVIDCDDVLTSRWSKWLGLPVSLLGTIVYLAIVGLAWPAGRRVSDSLIIGLLAAALLAAGAAVWFIGLQAIQLQSFCPYCLTIHCCGIVISVLSLILFLDRSGGSEVQQMRSMLGVDAEITELDEQEPVSVVRLVVALSVAAVGLVVLMGGQLLVEPAEVMAMEEVELQPLTSATDNEPDAGDGAELPDAVSNDADSAVAANNEPEPSADSAANDDDDSLDFLDEPSGSGEWVEDAFDTAPSGGVSNSQTIGSLLGNGPRSVMFTALGEAIDTSDMPVLGNPGAPHILLEMMDYTCHHCRKLHPHLEAAVERYGDQLGVIIYNVPLSKKCNAAVNKDYPGKKYACDYAQLSIGVWKLAPGEYHDFHDWLLQGEKVPSVTKAKKKARNLAGDDILLDKDIKTETSRRLSRQTSTFSRLKSGLPILLLENGALRGVPEESEKLFEYLEAKLGIEPQ